MIIIDTGNHASFAVDDQGDMWGQGLNTIGQTGTDIPNTKLDHTVLELISLPVRHSRIEGARVTTDST